MLASSRKAYLLQKILPTPLVVREVRVRSVDVRSVRGLKEMHMPTAAVKLDNK